MRFTSMVRRAMPILGIVCLTVALHFISPFAEKQLIPSCPSYSLTGTLCPGCGTLRALYCISHGEVWLGLRFNPILALALPLVVALVVWPRLARNHILTWTTLAVICAYWVLRNFAPFLAQPDMDEARRRFRAPMTTELVSPGIGNGPVDSSNTDINKKGK